MYVPWGGMYLCASAKLTLILRQAFKALSPCPNFRSNNLHVVCLWLSNFMSQPADALRQFWFDLIWFGLSLSLYLFLFSFLSFSNPFFCLIFNKNWSILPRSMNLLKIVGCEKKLWLEIFFYFSASENLKFRLSCIFNQIDVLLCRDMVNNTTMA